MFNVKFAFPWSGNVRFHEKALFKAWERQLAEMAGLERAFPRVHTHFNPMMKAFADNAINDFL